VSGSTFPRQEIACTILWNKAGLAVYGRHWSKLTPAEQGLIQTQVDTIAEQDGWEKDDSKAVRLPAATPNRCPLMKRPLAAA
jgi:hypothetical protein